MRRFFVALTLLLGLTAGSLLAQPGPASAQIQAALRALGLTGIGFVTGECAGWDATLTMWVPTVCSGGGGGGAPTNATYITQTPNAGLSAEQALSALATGLMQVTTTTGVVTSVTTSAGVASLISNETGSGALVFGTSPTLVTPILGTPTSATLTNATGLPIATGVSGLGAGVATFLATPSSANLAAAVTGETGSGAAVFATSPALTTPNLGTPSALTLTNATGLPTAGIVNSAVTLAKIQNAAANSVLVGSGAAGSGAAYTEITLGTNLSMSGTTLNASAASGAPTDATYWVSSANGSLSAEVVMGTPGTGVPSFLQLANNFTVDPNADRLLFWDDSATRFEPLTLGTNLSITGTTLNATGGGGFAVQEDDDGSIAAGTTGFDALIPLNYVFNGTSWARQTFGTAGTASAQVWTVQGIASMTPLQVQSNSANLATEATLGGVLTSTNFAAAFGTAGTADTQVMSVQGIASMTPLAQNLTQFLGSAPSATNPIPFRLSDGSAFLNFASDETLDSGIGTGGPLLVGRGSTATPTAMSTDDDATAVWLDLNGRIHGVWEAVEDAAETAGGFLVRMGAVVRTTMGGSTSTNGENATINVDGNGLVWTRVEDPCSALTKTHLPINISTATTTEVTPSLAGASTNYYVCSLDLTTAAANNVALVDDDSDGCGSVTSGMAGGTTAASGWNFAANGGLVKAGGGHSVYKTNGTNRVICLVTSAATQLSGSIQVVAAP